MTNSPIQNKCFVSEQSLLEDAYRLGVNIYNSGFRPSFIVGLWRGGSSVGIAVQECLQYLGVESDHISVRTSYRGMPSYEKMLDNAAEEIRLHGTQYLLETLNQEDALLIVDDVYSSGLTTNALVNRLATRMKKNLPGEIRIAAPWFKPNRLRVDKKPDFFIHETDDWLVMPYELSGLSRQEIKDHKGYLEPILAKLDEPLPNRSTD